MKAKRRVYNIRTNAHDESIINFHLSRVEWYELLEWPAYFEDEEERQQMYDRYGELFQEDTEFNLLIKMKTGEEFVIEFDPKIYSKLKHYFNE